MILRPGFAVLRKTGPKRRPDDPPNDPDVHFSADTQARWVRNGSKRTPGQDDIQAALPGRTRPGRGKFHRQGPHGKVHPTPVHRAGSLGFDTMIKGATRRRLSADKACASKANRDALRGRHRDRINANGCPSPPAGLGKTRGRLISKRRLRDRAMPMPR